MTITPAVPSTRRRSSASSTFEPQTPRRASIVSTASVASAISRASTASAASAASFASATSGISAIFADATTATSDAQIEWHVPSCAPTTAVGGGISVGHATTIGDAEQELQSLHVSSEWERAEVQDNESQSWGGRLLSSAVTATVFGAAVGLTVYRIWNEGWGAVVSSPKGDGEEDEDGEQEEHLEQYDEGHLEDEGGDRSLHEISTLGATRRGPRPRSHSRSSRSPLTPHKTRRPRAQRPSITDLIALSSKQSASQSPSQPSERSPASLSPNSDGSDDEWNTRLESMSKRVQCLINEGQRALDSPPSSPTTSRTQAWATATQVPPEPTKQPQQLTPLLSPLCGLSPRRASFPSTSDSQSDEQELLRSETPSGSTPIPIRINRISSSTSDVGLGLPPRQRTESMRSVSSTSSISARGQYAQIIPPLPWRKESGGTSPRWVQRPLSPTGTGSSVGRTTPPKPSTPVQRSPGRPGSGSRIPRPGSGHSRASSVASARAADSPLPRARTSSNVSKMDGDGMHSPPPRMVKSVSVSSGLVASRAALFADGRSKIPVRRSIGSISSIKAVVE